MPFSLHEDFSIRDERGRSCQIEIEENSALSNGHARITDEGKYHLTLNGNKHFLNTPALRNFRLKLDAALVIHSMEFGCGFLLYFRHDRRTGAGQVLKAYWDTDFTFTLSVNGRCLHTRKNAERPDFSSLKPALTVAENRLEFEWEGRTYAADIPDAPGLPERGAVGFDVAFSPGGTMLVSSVNLESDDALPKKRIGQPLDFTLACVQGFSEPLRYTVDLFRYETGEVELACTMGGTIRGRGPRKNAGGRQWTYESDRLTQPYLRIESDGEEWANLLLANGTLLLMDPEEDRLCVKLFPNIPWPARRRFVFRGFPEHFLIAAGYERAAHGPWRFAANGPYELIKTPDNRVVYEGGALRRDAVALTAASPADKRLTTRIPRETPGYDRALKHAAGQHYYFESERVSFTVTCTYRASRYERDELKVRAAFTDPYGGPLAAGAFTVDERGRRRLEGGFESRDVSITLAKNPGCGVYHLDLGVEAGPATVCESRTVFEVLSDDPAGPCPPQASRLPFLVAMPNECKYLETDAFDPWSEVGGGAHYYSAAIRYPAVGRALRIWDLLKVYRRRWMLMLTPRNSDDLEAGSPGNAELIRHADFVDVNDSFYRGRNDLNMKTYYVKGQLALLKEFIREKRPPFKTLTVEALDELEAKGECLTNALFADLFDTAWNDWVAYFRARIEAPAQAFVDKLLALNPRIGRASYGPYAVYGTHYKSVYALRYSGYVVEKDPRIRQNGSYWLFEDYHYSCDYPLTRAAYFVAGYDLHYAFGRRIYPEIYYGGGLGCNDGAVYQAHPPHGIYTISPLHQRRLVYQFGYGTPRFRDGAFGYWKDYGFHASTPRPQDLREFVYAWGKLVNHPPARPMKAPFVLLDLEQIERRGDYNEDECSFLIPGRYAITDVCNTAEEALGYAYETLCAAGYNTPVLSTFKELDAVTPELAEFLVLPPIVEGTPPAVIGAIRRAHERGIPLLCFESVCGLEDLFGAVPRAGGPVPVRELPGETFSHKMAVARYEAGDGAEVLLRGASQAGGEQAVPIAWTRRTAHGTAAFVNVPPTVIRRESYRQKYSYGQDTISRRLKQAMRDLAARLAPDPAVRAERGAVTACVSERGDLIVTLSEDSPIYGDTTAYPARFRFTVRAPGIEQMAIEADAPQAVVSRQPDRVVIRTETDKDSALFFRFYKQS